MKRGYREGIFGVVLGMALLLALPAMAASELHAVLVGVDRYADGSIGMTGHPERACTRLGRVLEERFGAKVDLLVGMEATGARIFETLKRVEGATDKEDRLLVVFSGAGEVEPLYGYGWWYAQDSWKNRDESRIAVSEIRKRLRRSPARQILLIADAPFPEKGASERHIEVPLDDAGRKTFSSLPATTVITAEGTRTGVLIEAVADMLLDSGKAGIAGGELVARLKGKKAVSGLSYRTLRCGRPSRGDVFLGLRIETEAPSEARTVAHMPPQPVSGGPLEVRVDVPGAVVHVDGRRMGTTPVRVESLDPGRHRIRVEAKGFQTSEQSVRVRKGEGERVLVSMVREAPASGVLTIRGCPPGTTVTLDGKPIEKMEVSLLPGTRTLRFSHALFQPETRKIRLDGRGRLTETWNPVPVASCSNALGMRFVRIPEGRFMMGSPESEPRRDSDEVRHEVRISRPFLMQETEVTVAQWRTFVNRTGYRTTAEEGKGAFGFEDGFRWVQDPEYNWKTPGFPVEDGQPVTCVSRRDAEAFARWLGKVEGVRYRLPTESEWEYACRAGEDDPFSSGMCLSSSVANYDGKSVRPGCTESDWSGSPVAVGEREANRFGLADMHGNVWEWCSDWYGTYPSGGVSDPKGIPDGSEGVVRGGGWNTPIDGCRTANRNARPESEGHANIGFRLVIQPME